MYIEQFLLCVSSTRKEKFTKNHDMTFKNKNKRNEDM